MDKRRTISISAALIVLICFFLPWVQVSCGGSKDTFAGVDLARDGHNALWLIPVLMLVVLALTTRRRETRALAPNSLTSLVAGLVSAYLMNRERVRAEDTELLNVRVTGWFWLGFGCSFLIAAIAVLQLLQRSKKET
ncbi:MAG TPA: hypothetical protein VJ124_00390 [Pyrinomonadaceae bacterium]|nr:hypothetical protein [Pyrinomonadaceae bacterium]